MKTGRRCEDREDEMTTEKVESDLKFWVDAYWEIEEDRLRGSGWELSLIVSHPMTHATLRFGPMAVASRDELPEIRARLLRSANERAPAGNR